ncbi:MAG: hypothetical protein RBR12_01200 [Sulfurospirillum cavolei]|nr:hypothetical protein [Sulfurospirillum cavolei]
MTQIEEKYNEIMDFLGKQKITSHIYPKDFNLAHHEFESLINEMEKDGHLNKGHWVLDGFYIFMGLTFKGTSFLQNNDKKQYSKIEKTEIIYNNNLHIHGDNYGNAVNGNGNTIQSPLEQKLIELIEAISKSQLSDKEQIIAELQYSKKDKVSIQQTLGKLLTRGAEISGIVSMITAVLSLC